MRGKVTETPRDRSAPDAETVDKMGPRALWIPPEEERAREDTMDARRAI